MRTPAPLRSGDPAIDNWSRQVTDVLDALLRNQTPVLPTITYAELTNPIARVKRVPGAMMYCPDYPDGAAIILAETGQWQVFQSVDIIT